MMMMLFLQSEDAVFAIGTPGPSVTGMRAHTSTRKMPRGESCSAERAAKKHEARDEQQADKHRSVRAAGRISPVRAARRHHRRAAAHRVL